MNLPLLDNTKDIDIQFLSKIKCKNNDNNNINNNENLSKSSKNLYKDIKFYKKRIINYNKNLINFIINKDNINLSNDICYNDISNNININNLTNPHIELYKKYIEKLIEYFKFIDYVHSEQIEIINYLSSIEYDKKSNILDTSYNIDNDIKQFNINNNDSCNIKKFIITNNRENINNKKILPQRKNNKK